MSTHTSSGDSSGISSELGLGVASSPSSARSAVGMANVGMACVGVASAVRRAARARRVTKRRGMLDGRMGEGMGEEAVMKMMAVIGKGIRMMLGGIGRDGSDDALVEGGESKRGRYK